MHNLNILFGIQLKLLGSQNLMKLAEAHTSQLKTIQGLTKERDLLPYHHFSPSRQEKSLSLQPRLLFSFNHNFFPFDHIFFLRCHVNWKLINSLWVSMEEIISLRFLQKMSTKQYQNSSEIITRSCKFECCSSTSKIPCISSHTIKHRLYIRFLKSYS